MSALGSLVVKLGLDYAQYTGGLDKSEQAALAASKKIQDTFDGMKARVAATAGAIAGGLAAGFTIAAFKNIISGAIETGAALDDLRMQTGASVEALSGLMAVGKFNNMGPEQIGTAMNKLAANLAGATEESKGTGKALEALGIDFDKFKAMRPEDQMQTVAKAMAGFEDGTGKAAVAMALYGKEGAKMLPFMHDLAEVGDLQAKVTTEQAAAAANLDDNLTRLSTSGEAWKKELANGMIPTLDLGAQALLDVLNGTGGLREEVKRLAADGSIAEWTTSAITGFSYVLDAVAGVTRSIRTVGMYLGATGAAMAAWKNGDMAGVAAIRKDFMADFEGMWTADSLGQKMRAAMEKRGREKTDNLREYEAQVKAVMAAYAGYDQGIQRAAMLSLKEAYFGADREVLKYEGSVKKAGKAAAEAKDPFDALRDSVVKATAAYQAEATAGEKLTEGQKKAVDVLDQLRTGKVKVTEAQAIQIGKDIEAMLAAEGENKAREEFIKSADAERAARLKTAQAMEQSSASLEEQNRTMRDEIELIGLTDAAQLRVLQQRNEAIILTKEATLAELDRASAITGTMTREQAALQAEIEALRERNELIGVKFDRTAFAKATEEQTRASVAMWQSVDTTAHDVFVNVADQGMSAFKRIGKTLKASVLDLLYQMTIKQWIISIAGSVSGGATGAALQAASGGGGILGMASNASSLYSAATGNGIIGNAVNTVGGWLGFGGAAASGLGMTAAAGAGTTLAAAGSGLGLAGSAAGAGYGLGAAGTGLGLSAGSAGAGTIGAGLGTSAAAAGGTAAAGAGAGISGALAAIPVWGWALAAVAVLGSMMSKPSTPHTGAGATYEDGKVSGTGADAFWQSTYGIGAPHQWRQERQDFVSPVAQGVGSVLDGIAEAFKQDGGFRVLTAFADDKSKDGAHGQLQISQGGKDLVNWEDMRTSKWAPRIFADGEAGQKEYLAAIANDTRQVLLDMDLPSWADTLLNSIGDVADMDKLSAAVAQISKVQTAFVDLGKTIDGFAGLSDKAFEALMNASGGIDALSTNAAAFYANDAYYSEAERTAKATQMLTDELAKYNVALPASGAAYRALLEEQLAAGEGGAALAARMLQLQGVFASTTDSAGKAVEEAAAARKAAAREETDAAYSALERSIAAERKALEAERDAASELADLWGSIADIAGEAMRDLRSEVASTAVQQAAQGMVFIETALAGALKGILPNAEELTNALAAARGGLDPNNYASQFELDRDRLVIAGQMEQLAAVAGKQKTTADLQLEALDRQIKQGDDTLDYWKQQIALATGTAETMLSVSEATNAIRALLDPKVTDDGTGKPAGSGASGSGAGGGGITWGGGTGAGKYNKPVNVGGHVVYVGVGKEQETKLDNLADLYHSFDGTGDLTGLLTAMRAAGASMSDLSGLTGLYEQDWVRAAASVGIPAFARGGDHRGGWAMVGEEGPELAYLPPARIYSASATRGMQAGGGNDAWASAMVQSVSTLATAVGSLSSEWKEVKGYLKTSKEVLEGAFDGSAMRTTPA